MVKIEKPTPKFLSFNITPKNVKIPRSGITPVKVHGTVESTSSKQYVDIILTPPKGKIVKSKTSYAETARHNVVKFEWPYGINRDGETGTYNVRAVLRENKNQVRIGTFRVE